MSSPAVPEREIASRRVAPASRLIPGARSLPGTTPRKKPQSVSVDGRYWAGEEAESASTRQDPDAIHMLAAMVLPSPSLPGGKLAWEVLADFLCLSVNFLLISNLRSLVGLAGGHALTLQWSILTSGLGFLLLQGTLLTLLGYSEGLYHPELLGTPREQNVTLGKVVGLSTLLLAVEMHFSGTMPISMAALMGSASLNYGTMVGWREWRRSGAARRIASGRGIRNVLIVGGGRLGRELASYLGHNAALGRVVRGFLVEDGPIGGDVCGTVDDLAQVARAQFVDEIILTVPNQPELARRVIREAQRNRLDVKLVPDLFGCGLGSAVLENFGAVPVLTLHQEPIPALGLFLKRSLDFMGAALGLLLASPLLGAIALLVKLDSRGPVFYRAPRVGKKGRKFICCKFRTMVTDADKLKEDLRTNNQREGPFFKIENDPRITHSGGLLRRYSLDELPQLWNVLKGEMSLVGPRPHPLDDFKQYSLEDFRRLDVTPGMTGLWQVMARRNPSFERNMALDLEYIEGWNLWMDLRILCKTIFVVLEGTGS